MLARNSVKLSLGELGSRIPLLVLEVVLARLLGPALYGVWSIIQTFATYGNFLHLGAASSLARREPGWIEHEALAEVRANRSATYGLQFFMVGIVAVMIILLSLIADASYEPVGGLSTMLALLLVILAQQITITTQASAINEYKIIETSITRLVYAFTFLLISLLVVRFQQALFWLTLGWATSLFVALALLRVLAGGLLTAPSFDLRRIVVLLKDGFPIMLQGVLRFGLVSIDKMFVFAVARPEMVGYYAMGSLAASVSGLFCTIVARVSLPTLLRLRDRSGSNTAIQAEFEWMTSLMQILTFGTLFLISSFSPLLVYFFLPSYQSAIYIIGILALAGGFVGFAQSMSDVAMSFGVKAAVLVNTSMALTIQVLLLMLAWYLSKSIEGIAISVLVSMVLMSCRAYYLAMITVGFNSKIVRQRLVNFAVTAVIFTLTCMGILELQIRNLDWTVNSPLSGLILNIFIMVLIATSILYTFKLLKRQSIKKSIAGND